MNNEFLKIPISILEDENLNSEQKIILSIIKQFCDYSKTGKATIQSKYFERMLNTTRKTIYKQTHNLQDMGYIKINKVKTEFSHNLINEYNLIDFNKSKGYNKENNNEKEEKPNFNPKRRGCPLL